MEFDDLTYACASRAERWSAKRFWKRRKTVLVGIGCSINERPDGNLLSWGASGATVPWLKRHEIVEGTSIVDVNGDPVWERDPAAKPTGLREVVVYTSNRVINDPEERASLHKRTKAHVVEMEAGKLARTGRLRRIVKVVTDDPDNLLRLAAFMLLPNGSLDLNALCSALMIAPADTRLELKTLWQAMRSLKRIEFA